MSTLHGSWILQPANSYFFLWGETWRNLDIESKKSLSSSESVTLHPFNLTQPELSSFLSSHNLLGDLNSNILSQDRWQTEIISLPSQSIDKKKGIIPVLSKQFSAQVIESQFLFLHDWKVEGFRFTSSETIQILRSLPLGSFSYESSYIGEDLRFWTHIYRWSLDLLARGKFLPGIAQQQSNQFSSRWYPLLDSSVDRSRFAKFIQLLPDACYSYNLDGQSEQEETTKSSKVQQLLLEFLREILESQLRDWLSSITNLPRATLVQPWLKGLNQFPADFIATEKERKRLETALYNWTLPVQDSLAIPTNQQLGKARFQVCFYLEPPTSSPNNGAVNWQLKYYLQALDNPDFLVDAETIWQNPVDRLIFEERTIEQPQETLLKGLGLASRLYSPIEESLQEKQPRQCELNSIQVYEFIKAKVWQFQDIGLGIKLPPGLASDAEEKRLGIKIQAEVTPKKGERLNLKSLLKYEFKIALGDRAISQKEFEQLLAQKSPLVEVNGEWIALQPADVRAAQAILTQSNEPINLSVEDALRLSSGDTKVLAKLPVVSFEASGALKELIDNFTNNQAIKPIEKPEGFKGELRPYQSRGVGWLAFLEKWGLGACLADDMGLGKTPQLLAFVLHLQEQDLLAKPTLIVCPTSVLNNWEREVKKFSPILSTFIHHGDKRSKGKAFAREIKNKNLVITSYSLVYRDAKTFEEIEWQGVVLDEAQNIKNPQAKQSQAVRKLKAGFRIALTGTPIENRLSELWSILDFLNPGFLGTQQFFQRRFAIPIEKYGDRESLQILRSLVRSFILRRLKTDKAIIQDLPEKQEMNVFCGLSLEQAELYQKTVDESLSEIEESTGIQRRGLILTLLLKLKQICNHPAHFLKEKSLRSGERSGKLLRLEEMLEELVEEGDRALIFTQFSEWGKLLQPYLEKRLESEILFLYGGTRSQQRQEMIDRFQNDPNGPRIFILSLKAGGTGLNLTRANHVFHVDRWWNPAVENQATDRAFRIGQKQNVQVHKFICTGTLEERINDTIESKKQLAEITVDAGEQWLTELDTTQLRNLLLLDRNAVIDEESP
jgi:SNF2 family DNA or RNA helicase